MILVRILDVIGMIDDIPENRELVRLAIEEAKKPLPDDRPKQDLVPSEGGKGYRISDDYTKWSDEFYKNKWALWDLVRTSPAMPINCEIPLNGIFVIIPR